MLTSRDASQRSRRLWTQAHRVCGYTFIALFAIFCYFRLLRVRGSSDELSPRLILKRFSLTDHGPPRMKSTPVGDDRSEGCLFHTGVAQGTALSSHSEDA